MCRAEDLSDHPNRITINGLELDSQSAYRLMCGVAVPYRPATRTNSASRVCYRAILSQPLTLSYARFKISHTLGMVAASALA
jgi:hypothetical protein